MADITRSIDIIFGAVDKTGGTVTSISSSIEGLDAKVNALAEPLADVAKKVLELDAALAALAVGGMAVATAKASEFNLAFAEITTLVDKPKEALSGFKDDILAYAQDSVKSVADINQALYEGISAGLKYEDSIKFIGEAEKLAVGSKADLTETTKTLISTLNAYGESTDQASKYSDILFQAIKVGQTTMPELSASLAQVTGIAASGKVPFETLSASIAALTASGLPTSQAITGIKEALSNIIKPTSEAQKEAQRLGVRFDATALATKGFDGVLKDVYKATGGNISEMAKLFGSVEGLNAAMVLASDKAGKFKESLDAMKVAAGSTAEAYKKMKDEFANVSKELVNNIEVALIKIGDKFIPGLTNVEKGLKDVFKGIASAVDAGAFDPLFSAIDKFGEKLGAEIAKIAKELPEALGNIDYTALIASISGLGTSIGQAFNAMFAGLDLTTPEGLSAAIQKVVDGITALTNVTAGIIDAWKPFLTVLGQALDYFTSLDASTQNSIGQILGWAQQIASATAAVGILTAAISLAGSGISAFGSIGKSAVTALSSMTTATEGLGLGLKNLTVYAAAFAAGWEIGKILYDNIPIVKEYGDNLGTVVWQLTHWNDKSDETLAAQQAQAAAAKELADKVAELSGKYGTLPDSKTVDIKTSGIQDAIDKCRSLGLKIDDIPREKVVSLMLGGDSISEFQKSLDGLTTEKIVNIITTADVGSIDTIVSLLKDKLPQERIQEIKTQLEEAGFSSVAAKFDGLRKPVTVPVAATKDASIEDVKSYIDYWFSQKTIEIKASQDTTSIEDFKKNLKTLPDEQIVKILATTDSLQLKSFAAALAELPKERVTKILADLDKVGFSNAAQYIRNNIPSEQITKVKVDAKEAVETIKDLGKSFLDLEKSKIEWTAKLNIADLEAQTKRVESAFNSINEGIKDTGDLLGKLFDAFTDANTNPNVWSGDIQRYIDKEYEYRQKEFDLQEKLVNEQVKSMQARTQAMVNGEGLIKVSADGLAPELEQVLYSFVKQLQVKVSQAGGDLLMGLTK